MPIKFCPRCNQSYVYSRDNTDFVHSCGDNPTASPTLKNEDKVNIGVFNDPDGSSGKTAMDNIGLQGTANKASVRAISEGGKDVDITLRGANIQTHRTRKFFNYINNSEKR